MTESWEYRKRSASTANKSLSSTVSFQVHEKAMTLCVMIFGRGDFGVTYCCSCPQVTTCSRTATNCRRGSKTRLPAVVGEAPALFSRPGRFQALGATTSRRTPSTSRRHAGKRKHIKRCSSRSRIVHRSQLDLAFFARTASAAVSCCSRG